jgi:uncharacterized alkaline shock family protein YloU
MFHGNSNMKVSGIVSISRTVKKMSAPTLFGQISKAHKLRVFSHNRSSSMDVNLIFSFKVRINSVLETWCSYL